MVVEQEAAAIKRERKRDREGGREMEKGCRVGCRVGCSEVGWRGKDRLCSLTISIRLHFLLKANSSVLAWRWMAALELRFNQ